METLEKMMADVVRESEDPSPGGVTFDSDFEKGYWHGLIQGRIEAISELIKIGKSKEESRVDVVSKGLDLLNQITGSRFVQARGLSARVAEGATLEQIEKVIRHKWKEWHGTEMEEYIRPHTLFGNKFWAYLRSAEKTTPPAPPPEDPDGRQEGADRFFDVRKLFG